MRVAIVLAWIPSLEDGIGDKSFPLGVVNYGKLILPRRESLECSLELPQLLDSKVVVSLREGQYQNHLINGGSL
jgi:hypothetical protein